MKNKWIIPLLVSMLIFVTGNAIADATDKSYFGIQYGAGDYSEEGISKDYAPGVFVMRLGRYVKPSFSVEARLGNGPDGDTHVLPEFSGNNVSLELDTVLGIYGVGHLVLTESSSIYGLLGVSKVSGTASVQGIPALRISESNSSFSYSIGADVDITDSVALNIEYMRYLDKSKMDLDIIALGLMLSF